MIRLFAAVPAFLLLTVVALAQAAADTTVHVPYGDVIGQLGLEILPWVGILLLGLVIKILPAPVKAFLTQQRIDQVEQLMERALGFAAANLQAQLKGRELTVDVKNQLVAQAGQYVIDHGSATILDFIGGETAIPEKLAARLMTSPSIQAAQAPTASATVATSAISQPSSPQ